MVYAVAVLLISSLTTVGLIAVWAATSPGNWFWRTMAFLGAMSPLLLIPAYEPFVAFVIQGAVVAAGVQVVRWRRARRSGEPFLKSQFSLKTILLAMVPAAVLAAVTVRLPVLNYLAWRSVVLIGLGSGITTLLGWWVAVGSYSNWKVRCLAGLIAALAVSMILVADDWFIICSVCRMEWPPNEQLLSANRYAFEDDPVIAWSPILAVMTLTAAALFTLVRFSLGSLPMRHHAAIRKAVLFSLVLIIAMPALTTYWILAHTLPIPAVVIPNPNGYDDFIAATQLLPARPLVSTNRFDPDTATDQMYEQALAEVLPALERVRRGMASEVLVPINYKSDSIDVGTSNGFRSIARGFRAQGRWEERSGNWRAATDNYLDGMEIGLLLARGGLIIDDLVGIACVGVAGGRLYEAKNSIPAQVLPGIIDRLKELETLRDPCEDVLHRDAVWSEHAMGWYGHLLLRLEWLVDEEPSVEKLYRLARNRELATLRLLRLELALRLYLHEHGKHPDSLDALVPKYIDTIPADPMSPEQKPLRCVEAESGIVPYSVGYNGIDDAGEADSDDPTFGDLRLDVLWAPQPAANYPSAVTLPESKDEGEADEDEGH